MKLRSIVDTACIGCGRRDKPHKGGGLCSVCYYRLYARRKRAMEAQEKDKQEKEL